MLVFFWRRHYFAGCRAGRTPCMPRPGRRQLLTCPVGKFGTHLRQPAPHPFLLGLWGSVAGPQVVPSPLQSGRCVLRCSRCARLRAVALSPCAASPWSPPLFHLHDNHKAHRFFGAQNRRKNKTVAVSLSPSSLCLAVISCLARAARGLRLLHCLLPSTPLPPPLCTQRARARHVPRSLFVLCGAAPLLSTAGEGERAAACESRLASAFALPCALCTCSAPLLPPGACAVSPAGTPLLASCGRPAAHAGAGQT